MPIRRLAILVLVAFAGPVQADATLHFVDAKSAAPQSRIAIAGDRLRVDVAYAPGNAYTVIDLKARTLTQVNPGAKASSTATIEQVQALINGINSAADPSVQPFVQLALDNLPADQRAQAQAMLRQSKRDEAIPFQHTAQTGTVAGIACQVYEQHSSGGDTRRLCVARYADLKLSTQDSQTLQAALDLLRETGGPWLPAMQLPGLPIQYSGSFGAQAYAGEGTLQSISHDTLAPAFFADPPNYRIVSLFEMLSLSGFAP